MYSWIDWIHSAEPSLIRSFARSFARSLEPYQDRQKWQTVLLLSLPQICELYPSSAASEFAVNNNLRRFSFLMLLMEMGDQTSAAKYCNHVSEPQQIAYSALEHLDLLTQSTIFVEQSLFFGSWLSPGMHSCIVTLVGSLGLVIASLRQCILMSFRYRATVSLRHYLITSGCPTRRYIYFNFILDFYFGLFQG